MRILRGMCGCHVIDANVNTDVIQPLVLHVPKESIYPQQEHCLMEIKGTVLLLRMANSLPMWTWTSAIPISKVSLIPPYIYTLCRSTV